MTTKTRPDRLASIPSLRDDEVCHIVEESGRGMCGAPGNCTAPPDEASEWNGQEVCKDCGRLVCPECRQLASRQL